MLVDVIVDYIKDKYNIEPERPWTKYPDNMTFKDKLTGKWFAIIMPVSKKSLGLKGSDQVYVINVKNDPDFIAFVKQTEGFLPAYHMNKKHWLTILLDGSVEFKIICDRIDESFKLINDTPSRRIYEAVKMIPRGKVATYGQVAELAGDKKMARAVGNALHKNPDPENVPCFRVVNSKGELAGEFAFGGAGAQARLLEAEGIEVVDGKVDLKKYGM